MPPDCPTPHKVKYHTRREAKAALTRRKGRSSQANGQVRPYRCDCGYWHHTHMPSAVRRKVRKQQKRRAA